MLCESGLTSGCGHHRAREAEWGGARDGREGGRRKIERNEGLVPERRDRGLREAIMAH